MNGFVKARTEDTALLRALAHDSEAHWGKDESFMDTFDRVFNITEAFIAENPVYIALDEGVPVAFWGLRQRELEYFYVAAERLGQGVGKMMWAHLTEWCKAHNTYTFEFVTSPEAVGFYEKMGAVRDGTRASLIDGRAVPRFRFSTDWVIRQNLNT